MVSMILFYGVYLTGKNTFFFTVSMKHPMTVNPCLIPNSINEDVAREHVRGQQKVVESYRQGSWTSCIRISIFVLLPASCWILGNLLKISGPPLPVKWGNNDTCLVGFCDCLMTSWGGSALGLSPLALAVGLHEAFPSWLRLSLCIALFVHKSRNRQL